MMTIAALEKIRHIEFEIEGQKFLAHKGEDVPELLAVLLAECARRNNANPALVRVNHNTWRKR